MQNPLMVDDNDDVKFLYVARIIGVSLILAAVWLLVMALFFSVPTMSSGTVGFIVMLFQFLGIVLCPIFVPGLLIAALAMRKSAESDNDKRLSEKKLMYAKRMRLIALLLAIYMVIMYIVHIVVTIGYAATHP